MTSSRGVDGAVEFRAILKINKVESFRYVQDSLSRQDFAGLEDMHRDLVFAG